MAGDAETGVTIHRTVKELDAGPIAAQRSFPIGVQDDAGAVYEHAAALAVDLLDAVLPDPEFTTQDEEDVIVKVHESKRNTITYGFGFEMVNRGGSIPTSRTRWPGRCIPPGATRRRSDMPARRSPVVGTPRATRTTSR